MAALLKLVCMAVIIYIAFDVVTFIYMKWTGKNREQSVKDIRNFLRSDNIYSIKTDRTLNEKMWGIVKSVIGDERFLKLQEASEELCLWSYDETSGVPCLQYSMDINEDEKVLIQERMKRRLKQTLELHSLSTKVLAEWGVNEYANMPCLYLYYAETEEQNVLLYEMARQKHNEAPRKGKTIIDKDV